MPEPEQRTPVSESHPPFFAGVDVGGTNLKIGIVDDRGQTLAYRSVPTETEKGPEDATRRMAECLEEMAGCAGVERPSIVRVGLGTPGTMDIPNGLLLEPHNLPGWFHFPIRDRLSHHCQRPVTFANDASAAAFGEFWCGGGREFRSMILLTLGTGVGGGIIVDGMSIDGSHNHGSECGHIIIDYHESARRCPCGATGHLEAYASATAVVQRMGEAIDEGRQSTLAAHREGGEQLTPLLLAREAEAGDRLSMELITETAHYLAVGIVTLMHTIDPDGVLLGGAMTFGGPNSPLGRMFLDQVRGEIVRRAFPVLADSVTIDYASLGGDAGYIGAAGLARGEHYKSLHQPE